MSSRLPQLLPLTLSLVLSLPLAAADPPAGDSRAAVAAAFTVAAAGATNEGSQIEEIFPLVAADGSAERAVFAAVVDGETCLWSTDGTAAGTFRVEPGGACVPLRGFPFVGAADGVAYFVAGELPSRYWRTDGTAAGTWPLTSFFDEGLSSRPAHLIAVPPLGLVVFTADDGVHGAEPWVSDGSPEGATLLADLSPGPEGSTPFFYRAVGSRIFFFVRSGDATYGLWVTDGTRAGTQRVDTVSSELSTELRSAYAAGDRLVFFLGDSSPQCSIELWASDGTAAGTRPIRTFRGTDCVYSQLFHAVRVAGFPDDLFFVADDAGVHAVELWRTDGTADGTLRLTELAPEQPFRMRFPLEFPLDFPPVGVGGVLLFAADDGTHGMEPWKSDGTPGGAELVADICPGGCSSNPGRMRVAGGRALFSAEEPTAGSEMWMSDGTPAGTWRATDLCPGTCGATISHEIVFGDSLLFLADDGTHGEELWRITPPAGTAVRLTDLAPARPFDDPFLVVEPVIVPLGARAVFAADDAIHGREPWVTDGTPAGTHILADLQEGDSVPLPDPPAAPANLRIEEHVGRQVLLRWDDRSDDETQFIVEIRSPGRSTWAAAYFIGSERTSIRLPVDRVGTTGFRVRATNGPVQSPPSNEVFVTITSLCPQGDEWLCLGGDRFVVSVQWVNQHAGPGDPPSGRGHAVAAGPGIDDSGYFWFFTPDNLELVVKVLDGTAVNGHFWVFWGALSDVEYTITVEDTTTRDVRVYHSPPGQMCGGSDTAAFPLAAGSGGFARTAEAAVRPQRTTSSAGPFAVASGPASRFLAVDAPSAVTAPLHPPQPCVPDDETLCLLDGALAVTVDWRDQHNGGSGVGHARPYTDLTGFFWFFHPENVELVVKALDGRTVNGKIWVFYGALSDVGYTIRVAHDEAHQVRTYENPPGAICGRGDTAAF